MALTDVDAAFGSGGRAFLDHFNDSSDYVDAVDLTPSGKLLIGGNSDVIADSKATLARYNLDGTPDSTFGTGGKVRLGAGAGFTDLLVNSNETITTLLSSTTGGVPYMRRYTSTGAVDSSFSFTVTGLSGTPQDMDRTADASRFYIVVGTSIARVSATGAADSTFGTAGKITIAQEANFVQFTPQKIVAMPDGGCIVAGKYGNASNAEKRAALRRFTSTGALDTTFGTGGTFTLPGFSTNTWTDKLMLGSDGKLLMIFRDNFGGSNQTSYVVKVNAGGTLDTTFNGDGITSITGPSAVYTETIGDLVVDSTGRMYGIGFVNGDTVSNSPSFIFRLQSNGNIDTTFATNGYNQTFFPAGQINWGDPKVVLASNGSLYHVTSNNPFGAAGVSQDQLIFKFDATTGAKDTAFGGGAGQVAIGFNGSFSQKTLGSDLLPDGGVAFAGYAPAVSSGQMIVGRLTAAGQPATFGTVGSGTVEVNFGTTSAIAYDVLGLPDGKIVVGGRASQFTGSTWEDDYAIARLNADGSLDTSFGTGGKVKLGYTGVGFEQIIRLAKASDGKILALGIHQIVGTGGERRSSLLKFNDNGTLDTNFGTGGRVLLTNNDSFSEIIPQADGSILLGGSRESTNPTYPNDDDAIVVRLLSNGAIDNSFAGGAGLIRITTSLNNSNGVDGMVVDSSGRIYVATYDSASSNGTLVLQRYSSAGIVDTTFGTNGVASTANPSNTGGLTDMKLTASGKILVYGTTTSSPRDVYLMQFLASGDLDLAFGTSGRQQFEILGSDGAAELFIGGNGHWTLTGDASGVNTLGDFAALRLMGTAQPADTTAPTVTLGAYRNSTAQSMEVTFSENVIGLDSGDVTLTRRSVDGDVNVTVPASWVSYNAEAQRLRVSPTALLPDGNYRLVLAAGAASDVNGNVLASPYTLDFFILAGDANGDRKVNSGDQSYVTSNLGKSGKTFADGDFDYSGTVDAADQAILTANLNVWLPAQGSTVALPVNSFAATYRLRRESATLLAAWENTAGTGTPSLRIRTDAVAGVTLTNSANDMLVADLSNGPLLNSGWVAYNGGSGTDSLSVVGSTGVEVVGIDASDITLGGVVTVRRTSVESVSFDGVGGWDTLTITGAGPAITLPVTQQLESLSIGAGAQASVPAAAAAVVFTRALTIDGKLNLADNDLLVDYSTTSPAGTWNQGAYNGVAGMITSGKITRTPGTGITLGLGEAREARQLSAGQTTTFAGQTIDDTTVIVKYTYAGDANLDGVINADDYAWIDLYSSQPASNTYVHGDFNYDGSINADDYALIDLMFLNAGGTL